MGSKEKLWSDQDLAADRLRHIRAPDRGFANRSGPFRVTVLDGLPSEPLHRSEPLRVGSAIPAVRRRRRRPTANHGMRLFDACTAATAIHSPIFGELLQESRSACSVRSAVRSFLNVTKLPSFYVVGVLLLKILVRPESELFRERVGAGLP